MKSATVLILFILSLIALVFALRGRQLQPLRIEPVMSARGPDAAVRPSSSTDPERAWRRLELGDKIELLRQLDVRSLERSAKVRVANGQPGY